jgi:hypothetical protein
MVQLKGIASGVPVQEEAVFTQEFAPIERTIDHRFTSGAN